MQPKLPLVATVTLLVLLSPLNALACACCAERGTYVVTKEEISEYESEVISGLKFGPTAHLFLDAGAFEAIRGLDRLRDADPAPDLDRINLESSFSDNAWALRLDAGNGLNGSLTLPVPAEMETFKVDVHDGRSAGAGGPLLYKELRFRGISGAATGLFGDIPKGTAFSLIFQGRGNFCDNTEDFTHWRLEFNESAARFSFYGKMASGDPSYFFEEEEEAGPGSANLPRFEDYKVAVFSGTPRAINFRSHERARMFRTRLREAWREGVNFAGSFIFTTWGCGTGCLMGAIIDARTGAVHFPKEMDGMGFGIGGTAVADEPMEFRKDSSLFILRGLAANSENEGTTYLVWNGSQFEQARFDAYAAETNTPDAGVDP